MFFKFFTSSLFLLYFTCGVTHAQSTFMAAYGGSSADGAWDSKVKITNDGFWIISETESYGKGGTDVLIISTDSLGKPKWARAYGGTRDDNPVSAFTTSDGGLLVTGESASIGGSDMDIFIMKIDASGNLEWNRSFGGTSYERSQVSLVAKNGDIYLAGVSGSYTSSNAFIVLRLSPRGNLRWARTFTSGNNERAAGMIETSQGHLLVTGRSLDGGSSTDFNQAIIKLRPNGKIIWSRYYGGNDNDRGFKCLEISGNRYLLAGYTESSGAGNRDITLISTDSAGTFGWGRTYGGSGTETAVQVIEAKGYGFAVVSASSSFSSSTDFLLIRTKPNGALRWATLIGGSGTEANHRSVNPTWDNGFLISGRTNSFGPGSWDAFLSKADSVGRVACNSSSVKISTGTLNWSASNLSLTSGSPNIGVDSGISVTKITNLGYYRECPIIPAFSYRDTCFGIKTKFSDSTFSDSLAKYSWNWNFGDPSSGSSNTSTKKNPKHAFSGPGKFKVRLIVGNSTVVDTLIKTITITSPRAKIYNSDTSICRYDSVQISSSSSTNYKWNTNSSLSGTNSLNPIARPLTDETYILQTFDNNGCRFSDTLRVTIRRDSTCKTDANLIAYYSFDNCDARDEAGLGDSGWVYGNPGCNCGISGNALNLDGKNDSIVFRGNVNSFFNTEDYSMSFYIRFDPKKNLKASIIGKRSICMPDSMVDIRTTKSSNEMFIEHGGPSKKLIQKTGFANCWQQYTIVRKGKKISVYQNGSLKTSSSTTTILDISNPANLAISNSPCIGTGSGHDGTTLFEGSLDEVRIYDKALTSSEVRSLYLGNGTPEMAIKDTTVCPFDTVILKSSAACAGDIFWSPGKYLDDSTSLTPVSTAPKPTIFTLNSKANSLCPANDSIFIDHFPKISPPTPVMLEVKGQSEIFLKWKSNTSASQFNYFRIFRRQKGSPSFNFIDSTKSTITQWTDTTASFTDSVSYIYLILTENKCGIVGDSSNTIQSIVLKDTLLSDKRYKLSWNKVSTSAPYFYYIQKSPGSSFSNEDSTKGLSYTNRSCIPPGNFRISFEDSNFTSISNIASPLPNDTTPPLKPNVELVSTILSGGLWENRIKVYSSSSTDVASYKLYYRKRGGSGFTYLKDFTFSTNPAMVGHTSIDPTKDYYCYYVKVEDSCGNASFSDTHCVSNLRSKVYRNLSVRLNWNKYYGELPDKYVIYKRKYNSSQSDYSGFKAIDSTNANDSIYTDTTGLSCNIPYEYMIAGYKSGIGYPTRSNFTRATPYDTLPPGEVNILSATVKDGNSIQLYFEKVPDTDVDKYEIRFIKNGGKEQVLTTINNPATNPVTYIHSGINTLNDTFCYLVIAIDSCSGNRSATSEKHCAVQLNGTNQNFSTLIRWSGYSGFKVDKYFIYKWSGTGWDKYDSVNSGTLKYTDTPLLCNTPYSYKIRAKEMKGDREISFSDSITLIPFDTISPAKPKINFVSVTYNQDVEINWSNFTPDVDRFVIFRKDSFGNYNVIDTVREDTSYLDLNAKPVYFSQHYRIEALDSCGDNRSQRSGEHGTIFLETDTIGCEQNIILTWSNYIGWNVRKFYLYRKENNKPFKLVKKFNGNVFGFTDSNLNNNISYCYRLQAYMKDGSNETYSNESCQNVFKPAPPRVRFATKTSTDTTNGEISIVWDSQESSLHVLFQKLYYKGPGDTGFKIILDSIPVTRTSFIHKNRNTKSGEHYYYLTAIDSCGNESNGYSVHKTMDLDFRIGQLLHNLEWTRYEGFKVENYLIQQLINGNYINVDTIPGTDTSWTKYPAPCNFDIIYRIAARSPEGVISHSDTAINRAIDTVPADEPTFINLTVKKDSVIAINFKGADSLDIFAFDLCRSVNGKNFKTQKFIYFTSPSENFKIYDTVPTSNRRLCYTIVTLDSCLNATSADTFCAIQLEGNAENLGNSLTWHPFRGYDLENYYLLLRNGNIYDTVDILPPGDTSYLHSGLPCNVPHNYKILGREKNGNLISLSDSVTLIPFDTIPPPAPLVLKASVVKSDSLMVWFDTVNALDVDRYEVLYNSENISFTSAGIFPKQSGKSPNVIKIKPGSSPVSDHFCLIVKAIDSCSNNISVASDTHCVVNLITSPGHLENHLTWSPYKGTTVDSYRVEKKSGKNWYPIGTTLPETRSFSDKNVFCNIPYTYRILTFLNTSGVIYTSLSDTSASIPFDSVRPAKPVMNYVSVLNDDSILMDWESSSPDVKVYEVSIKNAGNSWRILETVISTNYIIPGLNTRDSVYCVKVIALDSCSGNRSRDSRVHCTIQLEGQAGNMENRLNWYRYTGFFNPSYFIQKETPSGWINVGQKTDSFFTDIKALSCNIPNNYRILAIDAGDSSFSDTLTLTPFDTIPPTAGLNYVTVLRGGKVKLGWDWAPSSDVKYFEIWRDRNDNNYQLLETVIFDSVYIDSTPNTGLISHNYFIIAIDSCDINNRSNPSDTFQIMVPHSGTGACKPLVRLNSTPFKGFREKIPYDLFRSTNGGQEIKINSSSLYLNKANRIDFRDTQVLEKNVYCYRFRALDTINGFTSFSDTSCISPWVYPSPDTARIVLSTVIKTSPTRGEILIRWNKTIPHDTFARGYILSHGNTQLTLDTLALISDTAINSFTHTWINTENSLHNYRLETYNLCGVKGPRSKIHRPVELSGEADNLINNLTWYKYVGFGKDLNYELERSYGGRPFRTINKSGPEDTSFADDPVRCKIKYHYRIKTITSGNLISYSDTLAIIGKDTIPPTEAGIIKGSVLTTGINNGKIIIDFKPATESNRKGAIVFKSHNHGQFYAYDTLVNNSKKTISYIDSGINSHKILHGYFIRTFDSCGNVALPSDTHFVVNLRARAESGRNVITWSSYNGWPLKNYHLERRRKYSSWRRIVTLSGTFYIDSAVHCDSFYFYRITTENTGTGNLSFSNFDTVRSFENTPPDPGKIKRVTVINTSGTDGMILLEWAPSLSKDILQYVIYHSTDGVNYTQAGVTTDTTMIDSFLNTAGTHYYYKIKGIDSCGNVSSSFSETHKSIYTTTTAGNQQVLINWTPYQGWEVKEYTLFKNGQILKVLDKNFRVFKDTQVTCNQTYEYVVKATSGKGRISHSNNDAANPWDTKKPSRIELRVATVETPNNEIAIRWNSSGNFDFKEFHLYRKLIGENRLEPISTTKDTFYLDAYPIEKRACYYVRAEDQCKNVSKVSNEGCIIRLNGRAEKGRNEIAWESYSHWNQGVNYYNIYRSDDSGSTWERIAMTDGKDLKYSDKDLRDDTRYFCYRVEAVEKDTIPEFQVENSHSTVFCMVQPPLIYIPSAFSPGISFGKNDLFEPSGLYIRSYRITIFNRWGERIFSGTDNEPWTGKIDGKVLPLGIYVYMVEVEGYDGKRFRYQGNVTLLK